MTFEAGQLRAFLAVAEHGGVGRAAADLGLTQPAVSRSLRRLEVALGAPLFERHSTGMRLTEYGRALAPRARAIEEEAQRAVEEIHTMQGRGRGTLRVGSVGSVIAHLVPRAVDALLVGHPGLEVHILEGVEDVLVEALAAAEIDVAVGAELDADERIAVVGSLRWQDHVTVVAATGHPLRAEPGVELADLLDQRWAMPPARTAPRRALTEIFRRAGLDEPRTTVTTRSVVALKALVADAGFLSVMPRPLFSAERRAGTIESLHVPGGDPGAPVRGVPQARRSADGARRVLRGGVAADHRRAADLSARAYRRPRAGCTSSPGRFRRRPRRAVGRRARAPRRAARAGSRTGSRRG